jgi:hypothetical protein
MKVTKIDNREIRIYVQDKKDERIQLLYENN